jgi:hypothetical protein
MQGEWSEAVRRSLITLKALTYHRQGDCRALHDIASERLGGCAIGIIGSAGCATQR